MDTTTTNTREPLLSVRRLNTTFKTETGIVQAVRDVSWDVYPGEVLGVVGESGSGKSVSMASIMGLVPSPSGKATGAIQLLKQPVRGRRFEIPLVLGGEQGGADAYQLPFEDLDLPPGSVCLPDQDVRRGIPICTLKPEQPRPFITILLCSCQGTQHTQFFNPATSTKIRQDLPICPADAVKSVARTRTDIIGSFHDSSGKEPAFMCRVASLRALSKAATRLLWKPRFHWTLGSGASIPPNRTALVRA